MAGPQQQSCSSGQWRREDGSIVNGVACIQPDASWQMSH
jgi:hypothetical protein